jgi:hypothetical protein
MADHSTHRCVICDRTNSHELITYPEQYTPGPFRTDPHNELSEICGDCDDEVYDATLLWEEDDDNEEE